MPVSDIMLSLTAVPSSGLQPPGHFSGAFHTAMSCCPQSHQLFPAFSSRQQQVTAFNLQGYMVARLRRQSLLPSVTSPQGGNAPWDYARAELEHMLSQHPGRGSLQMI